MFDSALLQIEVKHINLEGLKKLLGWVAIGLLDRKEKGVSLRLLAFGLNFLKKKSNGLLQSVEKEEHRVKNILNIAGQELEVSVRRLVLKRRENSMKLILEIDKMNLDALIDGLMDEKFGSDSK